MGVWPRSSLSTEMAAQGLTTTWRMPVSSMLTGRGVGGGAGVDGVPPPIGVSLSFVASWVGAGGGVWATLGVELTATTSGGVGSLEAFWTVGVGLASGESSTVGVNSSVGTPVGLGVGGRTQRPTPTTAAATTMNATPPTAMKGNGLRRDS